MYGSVAYKGKLNVDDIFDIAVTMSNIVSES